VLVGFTVISFIYQWIVWAVMWIKDNQWSPDDADVATMVTLSIFTVLVVILGYFELCVLESLSRIWGSKGHGWERRNYKELSDNSPA